MLQTFNLHVIIITKRTQKTFAQKIIGLTLLLIIFVKPLQFYIQNIFFSIFFLTNLKKNWHSKINILFG